MELSLLPLQLSPLLLSPERQQGCLAGGEREITGVPGKSQKAKLCREGEAVGGRVQWSAQPCAGGVRAPHVSRGPLRHDCQILSM